MARAKYPLGFSRHFPTVALDPGNQAATRRGSGSGTSSELAEVSPEGAGSADIFTHTGRTPHNLARGTSVNVSGGANQLAEGMMRSLIAPTGAANEFISQIPVGIEPPSAKSNAT